MIMKQMTQLTSMCEMVCQIFQKKQEEKRIEEEQAANARYWKIPACCDDDDDYDSAITPILSTEETDNSLSIGDEHLDTILATESDEVIKSSVENLVPIPTKDHFEIVMNSNDDISSNDDDSLYNENIEYVEASPHNFEVVSLEVAEIVIPEEEEIEDDNLSENLLNVHLLIANIEALKDNPTPSFKFLTKSSSTSPKSFLEETNTFHNSLPEFENFYFDLEEISSGSTTTHFDISLSEYDLFAFDPSNDQFPPSNRSDLTHEEFADELAHIISPPEYDCFYFWNLPDPGELMSIFNSRICENPSTTRVNLPIEDDHSPLLAYVIWIFLVYLTYPVIPPYLHPFENEHTIFDPGITINHFYSFKPGLSHRCGAFKKFNTHRSHLNEWPMIINGKNTPILDYSWKLEDSCQRILSSKSSFPQLQLGINLLHLAGSQPMLKSSYKAKASVIISIPPLVGGVGDVVVEKKGTEVELKELPPHLEYAFLGDNEKWPVIIAKDLNVNKKTALINVLKLRKKAIA
nr:reverse transcriptase domain-containing protein [Tanacetum cinerariifolium]